MAKRKTCPICRRPRLLTPDGLCGSCSYDVGTSEDSTNRDFVDARYRAEVEARAAKRKAGKQGLTMRELDVLIPKC